MAQVLRTRLTAYLPAVLWMTIIFVLSSRSSVPGPTLIPAELAAAAGHLVVYAILAVLLERALRADLRQFAARAGIAWFLSVAYGVSDEIHQSYVPGRYASVSDVSLDAAGAALGLALLWIYLRKQRDVTART